MTLYSLITYPEITCWFCYAASLNAQAIASVKRQQQQLINACGGIEAPQFAKSKLAKQTLGYDTSAKGVQGKGKAKDKGEVKGKFDKDKSKDKGKDKDKGKTTLASAIIDRLSEKAIDEAISGQTSRSTSATRRKDKDSELDLQELLDTCDTIEELKAKLQAGNSASAKAGDKDKSLCNQNHERASAAAKALKKREELQIAIAAKDTQIEQLIEDFDEHMQAVREEYRNMRDCLD